MKIQLSILSALIAGCAAVTNSAIDLSVDIPVKSKLGNDILSKARRVNDAQEEQFTWQNDYSIRFFSCHTLHLFGGEEEGGGQEEGANPVGNQHLVKFKLCPTSSTTCEKCKNGGEYVVKMREFLEVYLQTKEELEQAQCEAVEENCNCDYYYGDDEACLSKCYNAAGLDFCVEDEEFNVEDYLECAEAEFSNDAYYASRYFIGPVCSSNHKNIHFGLFKDQSCSVATDTSTYKKYNYGAVLPYSEKSLVSHECISCKEVDENQNQYYNNNNNYYEAAEPIELCQQLYMQSAKCEDKMNGNNNPDVGSCTYIRKIIPALEAVYKRNGRGGKTATVFAWIFFLTTIAASAGLLYFFKLSKRKNVDLSDNGGQFM